MQVVAQQCFVLLVFDDEQISTPQEDGENPASEGFDDAA
jgi:hypothetical protein